MADYVDGKAAWLAAALPADGQVADADRIGALVGSVAGDVLRATGDPMTVRPNELVMDVVRRLRELGDGAPEAVHVTTAKGLLLGTVDVTTLLDPAARARATASAGS